MDTPDTASSELDTNQAAALFANLLEPQPEPENKEPEEPVAAEPEKADSEAAEPEKVDEPTAEADKVTIEVDGKTVELTKAELAEHYKNGLRQADYTKKTMETAEQRKAAEAAIATARQERQQYAQGLQQTEALLVASLQEQQKIDWDTLIQQDPQEYLKQKHLFESRQAALRETQARTGQLRQVEFGDRLNTLRQALQVEHQALLDKLPEWKDAAKAGAQRKEIADELISRGFEPERVFGVPLTINGQQVANPDAPGITDHKLLLLARDAMLYRQSLAKANAAAKKVSNLPQKVERPGVAENHALDGRSAAMRQLSKSGKVEDAARVFADMFK